MASKSVPSDSYTTRWDAARKGRLFGGWCLRARSPKAAEFARHYTRQALGILETGISDILARMTDLLVSWDEAPFDTPIPLLERNLIMGKQALLARVVLRKGCHVDLHSHVSEQFSWLISGSARWTIGEEGSSERTEFVMNPGQVLRLPSNLPHAVDALEDCLILDVLSPPGPMGVDSQKA